MRVIAVQIKKKIKANLQKNSSAMLPIQILMACTVKNVQSKIK